jgi:hypothetical protein
MRPTRFAGCSALLLAAACGADATSPAAADARSTIVAGVVTATRVAGGVELVNGDDSPVAWAVWNPEFLGLFGPCTHAGPTCPRLAPGGRVVVPLDAVTGATPTMRTEAAYWWHVTPDGRGGFAVDTVRVVPVTL